MLFSSPSHQHSQNVYCSHPGVLCQCSLQTQPWHRLFPSCVLKSRLFTVTCTPSICTPHYPYQPCSPQPYLSLKPTASGFMSCSPNLLGPHHTAASALSTSLHWLLLNKVCNFTDFHGPCLHPSPLDSTFNSHLCLKTHPFLFSVVIFSLSSNSGQVTIQRM